MSRIAVDIGGTKIKIGDIDSPQKTKTIKTPHKCEDCLNVIAEEILRLKEGNTIVVVACPGLISFEGVCEKALYIPLVGVNISKEISSRTGCQVIVDNDANVQALGFCQPNSIYISIGTGVGGAYINSMGQIERGYNNYGGEFGHLYVGGTEKCYCGKRGCLDSIVSGRVFINKLGDKWWGKYTLPDVAEKIRQAGDATGIAIAQLAILYNPKQSYIRGRICKFDIFTNAVINSISKNGWNAMDIDFQESTWDGVIAGAKKIIDELER